MSPALLVVIAFRWIYPHFYDIIFAFLIKILICYIILYFNLIFFFLFVFSSKFNLLLNKRSLKLDKSHQMELVRPEKPSLRHNLRTARLGDFRTTTMTWQADCMSGHDHSSVTHPRHSQLDVAWLHYLSITLKPSRQACLLYCFITKSM